MRVANTKEIKPRAYSAHMRYVLYMCALYKPCCSDNDVRHICIWCLREANTRKPKKKNETKTEKYGNVCKILKI